jgi:hypothetical protein
MVCSQAKTEPVPFFDEGNFFNGTRWLMNIFRTMVAHNGGHRYPRLVGLQAWELNPIIIAMRTFDIFRLEPMRERRNPLASVPLMQALSRLAPCEAPRRITELIMAGRVAAAAALAEQILADGDCP